jgi:DNA repair exonuclease SbcCD ATPase subunit
MSSTAENIRDINDNKINELLEQHKLLLTSKTTAEENLNILAIEINNISSISISAKKELLDAYSQYDSATEKLKAALYKVQIITSNKNEIIEKIKATIDEIDEKSSENTIIESNINKQLDVFTDTLETLDTTNQQSVSSKDYNNKRKCNNDVQTNCTYSQKYKKPRILDSRYIDIPCQHCDRDNQLRRWTKKGNVQCIDEYNCYIHIERVNSH